MITKVGMLGEYCGWIWPSQSEAARSMSYDLPRRAALFLLLRATIDGNTITFTLQAAGWKISNREGWTRKTLKT
jgi:hypothetical protein